MAVKNKTYETWLKTQASPEILDSPWMRDFARHIFEAGQLAIKDATPCAAPRGSYVPAGHMPTWSIQTCGVCGQAVACTEPRDFRPRPDSRRNQPEGNK
jgi:hypothetical protein